MGKKEFRKGGTLHTASVCSGIVIKAIDELNIRKALEEREAKKKARTARLSVLSRYLHLIGEPKDVEILLNSTIKRTCTDLQVSTKERRSVSTCSRGRYWHTSCRGEVESHGSASVSRRKFRRGFGGGGLPLSSSMPATRRSRNCNSFGKYRVKTKGIEGTNH